MASAPLASGQSTTDRTAKFPHRPVATAKSRAIRGSRRARLGSIRVGRASVYRVDFTEYDTRLAAYAVIIDAADRILLALWNEESEPLWTLPGGGVELHETIPQAIVREVEEETGYSVRLGPLLGIDTRVIPPEDRYVTTGRPLKTVRVICLGEVGGGSLRKEVGGTTDEARWFRLDELSTLPRVSLVDRAVELATTPVG